MTIVEGNPKAPFSIATTPRCRGGCYSFPGLLYFTLDPYLIMLGVKQGGIKYHFWVFGMTRPGIEPRSPGPLANTLTARPMSGKLLVMRSKSFIKTLNAVISASIDENRPAHQLKRGLHSKKIMLNVRWNIQGIVC